MLCHHFSLATLPLGLTDWRAVKREYQGVGWGSFGGWWVWWSHDAKIPYGRVGKVMGATESTTCSSSPAFLNDLIGKDQGHGSWCSAGSFLLQWSLLLTREKGDTKMCPPNNKLKHRSATFFSKRQIVNVFGFVGHVFTVTIIQFYMEYEGGQDHM